MKCVYKRVVQGSNAQLSLHFEEGLSGVPEPLSLLLIQVDISDTKHPASTELSGQAQKDLAAIDAIKALGKNRDRVNLPLVSENGSSQVGHGVAYGPGSVAFETDDFVSAVYDLLVYVL